MEREREIFTWARVALRTTSSTSSVEKVARSAGELGRVCSPCWTVVTTWTYIVCVISSAHWTVIACVREHLSAVIF